jgi:hypothetical protein
MKTFLRYFFDIWWLPVCFGMLTMLFPFMCFSNESLLRVFTCLLGFGVYVMACSVYKLSGKGNGMKVFVTCLVLLPAIIELGLFSTLIRIFGS